MQYIPFDLELYRDQMMALLEGTPDQEVFWKALDFAVEAHEDQWRRSGDAYILHPCSVAKILAEEMDIGHPEILAAALLHDTVEDVEEVTTQLLGGLFGTYVQAIVDGCTKVTHSSGDKQSHVKLVHRKIFSGAALRPEVMLVKLADRLHNLRTLHAMPSRKRQRIAQETIDIYAPLATAFGLFDLKREMYNLALHFKYPRQGNKLRTHIRQLSQSPVAKEIVEELKASALSVGLACRVEIRTKDLWAYYDAANRLLLKRIDTPVEIILVVKDVQECYQGLGIINQTFRPIPRSIRDFIANPKPTGYQGLHARAIVKADRFLFKIRTEEMGRRAQRGIFRNWDSKSGKQIRFIREIKEMFDVLGSDESVSYRDVIAASGKKEIYTYTPQGDLVCLPIDSNVLDFAFRVHTQIGLTCKGAVIRNERVQPDCILHDGDMVRIVRDDTIVRFEQEMLTKCKTPRTRAELSKGFRFRRQKVLVHVGQSTLRQEMLRYGFPFDILQGEEGDVLFEKFVVTDFEDLCVKIGEGRIRLDKVLDYIKYRFFNGKSPLFTPTGVFNKILLETLDPVCVKLSSCCKPNPTAKDNCALLTEKGLSVHHKKCRRLGDIKFQREDAVDVYWNHRKTKVRKTQALKVYRVTRKELMLAVSRAPETFELLELKVISNYATPRPTWEIEFAVPTLYVLQGILRHFDKSSMTYEFFLRC